MELEKHRLEQGLASKLAAIDQSQCVIEVNMDGTIITANENFLNVVGYQLEEVRGHHHSIFVDPERRASGEYKKLWDQLANGQHVSDQFRIRGKDNREEIFTAVYR